MPAFLSRVGDGEARATVLDLHTLEMHVDLSFSYLRFAEAASFDKKKSYAGAVQCTAPSYKSPNAGGFVAGSQPMSSAVHMEPK
jgi:hypothetical protein